MKINWHINKSEPHLYKLCGNLKLVWGFGTKAKLSKQFRNLKLV